MDNSKNASVVAYVELENYFEKRNEYIKKNLRLIKINKGEDSKLSLLKSLINNVLNDTNISNIKTDLKWFNEGLKESAKLSQDTLNNNLNYYKTRL
jgi:hypothetical protein